MEVYKVKQLYRKAKKLLVSQDFAAEIAEEMYPDHGVIHSRNVQLMLRTAVSKVFTDITISIAQNYRKDGFTEEMGAEAIDEYFAGLRHALCDAENLAQKMNEDFAKCKEES